MAQESIGEIAPRAQTALRSSPIGELRGLHVEEYREGLVLSGKVSSFYHKQLAQEAVRAVCRESRSTDVEVVNSIEVR